MLWLQIQGSLSSSQSSEKNGHYLNNNPDANCKHGSHDGKERNVFKKIIHDLSSIQEFVSADLLN